MKIVRNNVDLKDSILNHTKTYHITCENCDSELEVTDEDIEIGKLGMGYVKCPCCGENTYADEISDACILTKENLHFPQHYMDCKNAISLSDKDIDKCVKKLIEQFDPTDKNDWCRFTGTGDTMVFVFKFDEDREYNIYVCQNYYETYLPFLKNNS